MAKSVKPEFEDSDDEWLEFRFLAVSCFRIHETGFIHMSLDLGSREESENHIASAKSVIDTFPAWRNSWEEEASTRSFTKDFINAVNSAVSAGDFRFLVAAKRTM